jgi:DNA polymerase-4
MRLRSYGCIAGALHVKVKFRDHDSWERQARFDPTSDTLQLLDALEPPVAGLSRIKSDCSSRTAVAVALSRLDEQAQRATAPCSTGRSHDKLNAVIDSVNLRYGRKTLYFGGAHRALQAAPMRIAFNHIPDLRPRQTTRKR